MTSSETTWNAFSLVYKKFVFSLFSSTSVAIERTFILV